MESMATVQPIKIPAECPFRADEADPPDLFLGSICCKRAFCPIGNEPPLCRTLDHELEAYRLHVDPSFDPYYSFHLGRSPSGAMLVLRRRWDAERRRTMTDAEWSRLQELLNRSDIWRAPSDAPLAGGLDGTRWTFEARVGDRFHFVQRWPHAGELGPIDAYLCELAGFGQA